MTAMIGTHWEVAESYGGSELFYLVQDEDGQILVTIVHGDRPNAPWSVCIGSHKNDFINETSAKAFAERELAARARATEE
jgi:hypothetical protein